MELWPFILTALTVAGAAVPPIGPVRTVTVEPGVLPPGTQIMVRTSDTVRTHKAFRSTVYGATVAEDIMDQNGTVLIPIGSPVELVVRSVPYLGPGGVGMTQLRLEVRAVTVNGFRYPVATGSEKPGAGGLWLDRDTAKWVSGDTAAGAVVTAGPKIYVPADSLLAFRIDDPIRLIGYRP
jgi:3D (Asp-Asp-Asp) domain-containing protein